MSTANRLLDMVEDNTRKAMSSNEWQIQDPEESRKIIEGMYKTIGLDAKVDFVKAVTVKPVVIHLPESTLSLIHI